MKTRNDAVSLGVLEIRKIKLGWKSVYVLIGVYVLDISGRVYMVESMHLKTIWIQVLGV